jgi:hypothetical protein
MKGIKGIKAKDQGLENSGLVALREDRQRRPGPMGTASFQGRVK